MRNILFLLSLLILYSCTSNSEIEFRENTKFENLALTRSSIDLTINHPNLLISKNRIISVLLELEQIFLLINGISAKMPHLKTIQVVV